MKTLAEQIGNKCIHFNGVMNDCCKAGVSYSAIRVGHLFPCFKGDSLDTCDKREFPSDEQVAARVNEIEANTARTMTAMVAVCDEAKRLGLKNGKGGGGQIECPVCKTGTLGFSVASYNGHIWGKCSTKDCVAWMQ
jgi:hypothetical protein